jgi:hypothetical protein
VEQPAEAEPVQDGQAHLVGSPPGALPEELGGTAAMVGNREAEGSELPDQATSFNPDAGHEVPAVAPAPSTPIEPEPAVESSPEGGGY